MIKLDTSQFAPDIATALLLRGAEVPSLQWYDNPLRAAKTNLDANADDAKLFARRALANEDMAGAVRALLYLWNGWPNECSMYAQAAPEKERHYIEGLRTRQAGHTDDAKIHFQKLEGHEIFAPLAEYATKTIGLGLDPALKRFCDILKLDKIWEPFAFIDLFEQTRAGKLCSASDQVVRKLQCREFEMLLCHCYEAATGQSLATRSVVSSDRPRSTRTRPTQRRAAARRPGTMQRSQRTTSGAPTATAPPIVRRIAILCPKCQLKNVVPETNRGAKTTCIKCGAAFLIPRK